MSHSDSWDNLTHFKADTPPAVFSGFIPGRFLTAGIRDALKISNGVRFSLRFRHASWILLIILFLGVFSARSAKAADCTSLDFLSQPPSSVIFVGDFESGVLETWGNSRVFSAVEVLDINILVGFDQSLTGDHLLEIVLRTPNGHLYQKLATPVSSDTKRSGMLKKIPGFPKPMPIQITNRQSVDGKDVETAVFSLPVGGTSIETASMYGLWSVQVFLDGQASSCGRNTGFMIIQ